MKRAAALLLLAGLLLGLSACGGGAEGALRLARSWDEERLWGCRYEAACAGSLFVLSIRGCAPEAGPALSPRAEGVGTPRPGALGSGQSAAALPRGADMARELDSELRAALGGGWDVLIVFYTPGGRLYGTYLNGERQCISEV